MHFIRNITICLLLSFITSCPQPTTPVEEKPTPTEEEEVVPLAECTYWPKSVNESECAMSDNKWHKLNFSEPIIGVANAGADLFLATSSDIYRYSEGTPSKFEHPRPSGAIQAFAQPHQALYDQYFVLISGTVYIMTDNPEWPWTQRNGDYPEGSIQNLWIENLGAIPVIYTGDNKIASYFKPSTSTWLQSPGTLENVTVAGANPPLVGTTSGIYSVQYDESGKTWIGWASKSIGIEGKGITDFVSAKYAAGPDTYTTRYLVGTTSGLFCSEDLDAGWTPVEGDLSSARITSLARVIEGPGKFYAVADGKIYSSTDLGKTWTLLMDGVPNGILFTKLFVRCHNALALAGLDCSNPIIATNNNGKNYLICHD